MTNDLLRYGENICAFPHIPFLIYDSGTSENFVFFFISVEACMEIFMAGKRLGLHINVSITTHSLPHSRFKNVSALSELDSQKKQ